MSHLIIKEGFSKSGITRLNTIISAHDKSVLGYVCWDGGWRQYVFEPVIQYPTKWSWECLAELQEHIIKLNQKHKDAKLV